MAGIGILVDDGITPGYAYKALVPPGTLSNSVIDLSSIVRINDSLDTTYSTYSSSKIQELHNSQAEVSKLTNLILAVS